MSAAKPSPPKAPSGADHYRRRRLIGLAAGVALLACFVAIVAVSAGSSGRWDPRQLEQGAIAEKPKIELAAQARAAAAVLEKRKALIAKENVAIKQAITNFGVVSQGGPQNAEVALTFDDGPSSYTGGILDTLKKGRAAATFFTLGNQTSSFPLPLQRAVAEGHVVSNHTWSHQDLTRLSPKDVRTQLTDHTSAVTGKGLPAANLFRPPYGAINQRVTAEANRNGMLVVMWSIDSNDYKLPTPAAMAAQVISEAQNGSIILMHDGGGNRTTTSIALPLIIKGLRAKGFKMVTVPQLLLDNPPEAQQQEVPRTPVA